MYPLVTELDQLIIDLCAEFGGANYRGVHDHTKKAYVKALEGLPIEGVRAAFKQARKRDRLPKPSELADMVSGPQKSIDTGQSFFWSLDGTFGGNPNAYSEAERESVAVYVAESQLPSGTDLIEAQKRHLDPMQKALIRVLGFDPAEVWQKALGRWSEIAERKLAMGKVELVQDDRQTLLEAEEKRKAMIAALEGGCA